jgi:hypothetical protein
MANHQVPRTAECTETLEAPDAAGATVRCRVYRHTRAGHSRPMFYVVQYRLTAAGRIDRGTRVTNQISGARARARLDAEMTGVRAMFAAANVR